MGETTKYKVIILGNSAVGKTSLLRRLRDGDRAALEIDLLTPTIGVDLQFHRVTLQNGVQVELQIWDTAGQERFHRITRQYYRGAHGIVFVYDVTNRASYSDITRWLHCVNDSIDDFRETKNQPVFILLGNKVDLLSAENHANKMARGHLVSHDDGLKLHDRCNMSAFFEVSAKTGENVLEAFERLAFCLVNNWNYPLLTQNAKNMCEQRRQSQLVERHKRHSNNKDLSFHLEYNIDWNRHNGAQKSPSSSSCFTSSGNDTKDDDEQKNSSDSCLLL